MSELLQFHFLRPGWLLLILPALALLWWGDAHRATLQRWRHAVAPHLLKHLVVNPEQQTRWGPGWLAATVLVLGAIAAAGPTWERETPLFMRDEGLLVIAVDLSTSMAGKDIQPSRLARATLKLQQLITLRGTGPTALIGYAGSAHLVLPFTEDPAFLRSYLPALSTHLPPRDGKRPDEALRLAGQLLKERAEAGSVLLVTDQLAPSLKASAEELKSTGNQLVVLLLQRGDVYLPGVVVKPFTDDDQDLKRLRRTIGRHWQQQSHTGVERWQDVGYYLTWPILGLALCWFRRGWPLLSLALLLPLPQSVQASDLLDWWLTPQQRGAWHWQRGDYRAAAAAFSSPYWKGLACERVNDTHCAAEQFSEVHTAEGFFLRALAEAKRGRYAVALASMDAALLLRPQWPKAEHNRVLLAQLAEQYGRREDEPGEPKFDADEERVDEKGKRGKSGQINTPKESADTELWLRRLPSSAEQFLQRKFARQLEEES
jgi:Ca-activated chloride channel family protein